MWEGIVEGRLRNGKVMEEKVISSEGGRVKWKAEEWRKNIARKTVRKSEEWREKTS